MFEPTIIPKEKPVVDVTKPGTLASDKWNLLDTTEVDVSDEDLLGPQTPTGIEGPPSIISQPTPDNILAGTDDAFSYLDVSDEDLYGGFEQPTEEPVTGIIGPAGTEPFVSDFGKEDVEIDQGFTGPDKETDRVKQIDYVNAQTGPVLLVHRPSESISMISASIASNDCLSKV